MGPKPQPKPTGTVETVKPFLSGRAAAKEFFDKLATASDVPVGDIKRLFENIQQMAVQDLKSTGAFTLHTLGTFHVKTMHATAEGPGECHGTKFTRREKPSRKYVVCKVAAPLNDRVVN